MIKKIFFLLLVLSFVILILACEEGISFGWDTGSQNFHEEKEANFGQVVLAYGDLDMDGENEQYILKDGRLSVVVHPNVAGAHVVWQSPPEWRVSGVALVDSTGDGVTDVNFSVWKPGNYGSSKPFWVKENDQSIKNHFFVFDFVGGKMKPLWQSSNLPVPNCEFVFGDVDGDGKQNLAVLEGDYSDEVNGRGSFSGNVVVPACVGRYVAVWQWDQWGFVNISRSVAGHYKNLRIERVGGVEKVEVEKN